MRTSSRTPSLGLWGMSYDRKIPCIVRAYSQYSRSAAKCQPFLRKKGGVQPHLFFQKRNGAIAAVARGRGGGINRNKKKGKRRKEAQHHESPMPNGTKAETETQPYKTQIL